MSNRARVALLALVFVAFLTLARQARGDVHVGVDEDGCGWIEDDHPIRNHGYPSKRQITPAYPASTGSC